VTAVGEDYVVTLGERRIAVRLVPRGAAYEVTVDGRTFRVDARRLPGSYVQHLLIEGRSHEANVRFEGDLATVHLGGTRVDLRVEEELWARASGGSGERARGRSEEIVAPMPGTIVSVHAEEGAFVPEGARVVVVEAMKMQNEIAPVHGGVVVRVHVKAGDAVDAGAPLVSLRPAPREPAPDSTGGGSAGGPAR
jgi:biotin carboxyl carrier protein